MNEELVEHLMNGECLKYLKRKIVSAADVVARLGRERNACIFEIKRAEKRLDESLVRSKELRAECERAEERLERAKKAYVEHIKEQEGLRSDICCAKANERAAKDRLADAVLKKHDAVREYRDAVKKGK